MYAIRSYYERNNKEVQLEADFVVVGGGLSGVCAAVTAARKGTKTILIQDRPVFVITSYSIHYTKLYEFMPEVRLIWVVLDISSPSKNTVTLSMGA